MRSNPVVCLSEKVSKSIWIKGTFKEASKVVTLSHLICQEEQAMTLKLLSEKVCRWLVWKSQIRSVDWKSNLAMWGPTNALNINTTNTIKPLKKTKKQKKTDTLLKIWITSKRKKGTLLRLSSFYTLLPSCGLCFNWTLTALQGHHAKHKTCRQHKIVFGERPSSLFDKNCIESINKPTKFSLRYF